MMEKRRFFVGNLPNEIEENVIKKRFSKYGDVLSVELKRRYGGSNENDILSTFAFVEVQGSEEAISMCLKKLSRKKWLDKEVTVQFAKESVLSRLENERKSNMKNHLNEKTDGVHKSSLNGYKYETVDSITLSENSSVPKASLKRNSNSVNDSSSMLTKLEMFSDVWKDCDDESSTKKINKFDNSVSPIVRTESFQGDRKTERSNQINSNDPLKDKKSHVSKDFYSRDLAASSEEKRLKSVEEMKKVCDLRKQLVKKALSSVDSGNLNRKIIFNDDDDDNDVYNNNNLEKTNVQGSVNKLFNDDSEEDDEVHSFGVKQQFEGEKGKKLFQLQSKFGNDSRFAMDERFYDSDEENGGGDDDKRETKESSDQDNDQTEDVNDEVEKQLEILQSIVGDKDLARRRKKQKLDDPVSAAGVRFDPSIPEHEKFIMKPAINEENVESGKDKSKKSKNKQKLKEDSENYEQEKLDSVNESNVPKVSKETFYEVADELKDKFKSAQKSSFSFSEVFKSSSGGKDEKGFSVENPPLSTKKKTSLYNNISDDRFGGDFNSELDNIGSVDEMKSKQFEKHSGSLWHENFFYKSDDPRLEEGQKFFSRENVQDVEDFDGKRKELKKIIKKKVMNKVRSARPFKKKIGTSGFRKNFRKRRKFH